MGSLTVDLDNGADPIPSFGRKQNIRFSGTWAVDDEWRIRFITTTQNFTIGQALTALGEPLLAGTSPTNGNTVSGRVYLAAGKNLVFCDNNDPTEWYEQGAGAGYVSLLSQYGNQDAISAIASYQGRLAVFLRKSIQIWKIDPDVTQFALAQTLANIGTNYGFSVQSLGDWDVLFLSDSGIRSLRVRDSSLNAVTTDIGSPIDPIVIAVLEAGGVGTPVSIVEPTNNRYWLYLNGTIYVLSLFADAEVRAWSTYRPTANMTVHVEEFEGGAYDEAGALGFSGILTVGLTYTWTKGENDSTLTCGATTLNVSGSFVATSSDVSLTGVPQQPNTGLLTVSEQTIFAPSKFVVNNGRVYCRGTEGDADWLFSYGESYDNCIATVQSPFLSLRMPSTNKYARGVDLALTGTWALSVSMDQHDQTFETVDTLAHSTYDGGVVGFAAAGTHAAFKLVSSVLSNAAATVSTFTLIYNPGDFQ